MAIVLVLGDSAPVVPLARALRSQGERPVFFAYDHDAPVALDDIPTLSLSVHAPLTDAARRDLWYEIDTYARRSHPSLVVADLETAELCAGAGGAQVLLVDADFRKRHPLRYRHYVRSYTEVLVLDEEKSSPARIARSLESIAHQHRLAPPKAHPGGRLRPISVRSTGNSVNHLVIRFDDITELDDEVVAIVRLCLDEGLCLSLDVIPYLRGFNGDDLRALGAAPDRVEVAQHGYSHVRRVSDDGRKTEFVCARDAAPLLAIGKAAIDRHFPEHFHGGYSAPYDFLGPGVTDTWQQLGGRYVSSMSKPPSDLPLPCARLTTDPWDWAHRRPRPTRDVLASLDRAANERGVAGLVLHPAPLRTCDELDRMREVIRIVARRGFTPALVSAVAADDRSQQG